MSYDLYFHGFTAGESSGRGGQEMATILRPYIAGTEGAFSPARR